MKKALLITVDGRCEIITPEKGKTFSYEEIRDIIGGIIQYVPLPGGREIICHDEGKLIGLEKNEKATAIWKKLYPLEVYPENNDELVVGDVLICGRNLEALM